VVLKGEKEMRLRTMNLTFGNPKFQEIHKAKKSTGYGKIKLEDFVYDAIMYFALHHKKK